MKKRGIMVTLLLGLLLISTIACSGGDQEPPVETVKNNINVTVTGDGNIEASYHRRLTFGSGGKVDKIYVKEGDKVKKGDVLAKLDTDALELALNEAQVALTQAELAWQSAERNLKNTQDMESNLELALSNAQIDVRTAKINLEQTQDLYTPTDIRVAKADVDAAEDYLEENLEKLYNYLPRDEQGDYPNFIEFILSEDYPKGPGFDALQERIIHAQARLNAAKNKLDAILSGFDADVVAVKKQQVIAAEKSLELALNNLNKLGDDLAIKALEVEYARQNVILAQKSLGQAKKDLEEATLIAPFDGMVANIGVKEGEFLSTADYTGTTIVELIDPRHMELTARVDELDVVKVKTGQKVMISVDAIPEMKLEGWVTFISPVAREPGVVLFEDEDEEKEYEVKIDFNISGKSPIRAGMSATAEIIIE